MAVLDVGEGVEVDINDEADTFWVAFDEYISEVIHDDNVATAFKDKFMDSHHRLFRRLNLEQLEDVAKGIFQYYREQELGSPIQESLRVAAQVYAMSPEVVAARAASAETAEAARGAAA
mmetsp:Transcript_13923/g.29133  ORF Transcript_13923/g.29133 Transcript_13923/m.29133 type:complete len:119 (+) Transcript_13923:2-358(+)